jgi:S-layer homology domain
MRALSRFARVPLLMTLAISCSGFVFAVDNSRHCSLFKPSPTLPQAPLPAAELGDGGCTAGNIIQDGGFEAATGNPPDSPNWTESSTQFGTPICSILLCGSGGGSALPRTGNFWAWFGGAPTTPEVSSLSQAVTFPPAGATVTLNFYLWIGAVNAPFNDTLVVKVDGVTQATFTEPVTAEAGYTLRSIDVSAFANGASRTINFLYTMGGGTSNFSVDDVSLDVVCNASAGPVTNEIDPPPAGAPANNNGVFDPNETVLMQPTWVNTSGFTAAFSGTLTNFTGPGDGVQAAYTLLDPHGHYGATLDGASVQCTDCYLLTLAQATRPVQHWDATVHEELTPLAVIEGGGIGTTWTLHIGGSFIDVNPLLSTNPFYPFIESIFHHGVTSGCGDGSTFCPLQNTLRQEVAVFLLRGALGPGYTPPACTPGVFGDVDCSSPYAGFIEDLKTRGITSGCGDGSTFCPDADLLRQEMAVFLLKALLGSGYTPPVCTPGIFGDVDCSSPYADWIEDLKTRGVTAGCHGGADFCPTDPVTRQEVAAFLSVTFGLGLYGP